MAVEALSFNTQWRKRIDEIGLEPFIREEMLRLGFWQPGAGADLPAAERQELLDKLDVSYKHLVELKRELHRITAQISALGDVDKILGEIRLRRIERVSAERQARKLRKQQEGELRHKEDLERRLRTPPFLGHGVSSGLSFEGGDLSRLESLGLPMLLNVDDMSAQMGIEPRKILWLAYHRKALTTEHYTRFVIPKRSGGQRVISAPKPELKLAQGWIAREVLSRLQPEDPATAFRAGASILKNARMHSGRGVVVRFDLKDFFPTISFPRVRGMFCGFGYNPGVASILALLCTEAPRAEVVLDGKRWFVATGQRRLPQGAPTSPAISNLITRRLDRRLQGLVNKVDSPWVYSRYADDMVFSNADPKASLGGLMRSVEAIVKAEGFELNPNKTAVMRQPQRQIVTGLLVNDQPRIPRASLRRFRALLHACERDGFEAMSKKLSVDSKSHARGYFDFIKMVTPEKAESFRKQFSWLSE